MAGVSKGLKESLSQVLKKAAAYTRASIMILAIRVQAETEEAVAAEIQNLRRELEVS